MSCDRSFASYSAAAMAQEPDTARRLGGSPVIAAALLDEIFNIQEARMSTLLANYPRPTDGVPALQARAQDARAREETLRLFRAIVAAGYSAPSHAEIASGDGLPLPPLASQYAYAEVARTLDAARDGRPLPELAEEVLAAQRTRAVAAYAEAAQIAVRRIPNILDVANRFGIFVNQRTPLAIARQVVATADVPDHLRRAAEQYLADRGAGMARFAQILCNMAGVPRCAHCGCYVNLEHTCDVAGVLVESPQLLRLSTADVLRGEVPPLTTLAPEARDALAQAAVVLEDGPGVGDALVLAANLYRAWHSNQYSRRTAQPVGEAVARRFLPLVAAHLAKTLRNDPAAARIAGQVAARAADNLEALVKRTAMASAADARYEKVIAQLRQVAADTTPEAAQARLSGAMRALLNADGPGGAPTAELRALVRSTYEDLRPINQTLAAACRPAPAAAQRVAENAPDGAAAAAETVLGYWRADGGPEGGPRRATPGPLRAADLDRLRASPSGKALLTLLCNQAAKESGDGTEQTKGFYRIKPALLADAIADLDPDGWGYTYHEHGERGKWVVYLHSDIGSIPFHIEGTESELLPALQSKPPDNMLKWSRIPLQPRAVQFVRGWLDSRLTTGQGQGEGWDALRRAARMPAEIRPLAMSAALRTVAPELTDVECHQAIVTLRRLGEPSITRSGETVILRRLAQLGGYRDTLNLARAQARGEDRQALLLGLEDALPPAASWSPAAPGDAIVTTLTPDAHREHVVTAQTPGRVAAFDGPYVVVAFALPLTTAGGQRLEPSPERTELEVRYLPDEITRLAA
jgi:hypothetical protein